MVAKGARIVRPPQECVVCPSMATSGMTASARGICILAYHRSSLLVFERFTYSLPANDDELSSNLRFDSSPSPFRRKLDFGPIWELKPRTEHTRSRLDCSIRAFKPRRTF